MQSPGSSKRRKVLVVDDDPGVLFTLKRVFSKAGYDVTTCADGPEAVALVQAQAWDLLMTDINLPSLGGLELVAQVRKVDATLPIVVMTAHSSSDTIVKAISLSVHEILRKPFADAQDILATAEAAQRKAGRSAG